MISISIWVIYYDKVSIVKMYNLIAHIVILYKWILRQINRREIGQWLKENGKELEKVNRTILKEESYLIEEIEDVVESKTYMPEIFEEINNELLNNNKWYIYKIRKRSTIKLMETHNT